MNIIDKVRKFSINVGILKRPKISLLIPFSTTDKSRHRNFYWLLRYWECKLPKAEIVIGESKGEIFCKGEALNDAFRKSNGKIVVVLDADALIDEKIIEECADKILHEAKHGHNLWYVPYRLLIRLAEGITERIVKSNPCSPLFPSTPPNECDIDNTNQKNALHYGHMYGAMITILPRIAIEKYLLCFDEHFVGWGGEDISFLRMMDTLFGKHKTTNNAVFHLWHPFHGKTHRDRTWDNQDTPNMYWKRGARYMHSYRKVSKMQELVNENYGYYQNRKRNGE